MIFSAKEVMCSIASKSTMLKPVTEDERHKLQQVLTNMLDEVQCVCDKIGVQIVLCGGSCLGAVRHKGFIPWDDDLDIAITRKDWEKFKDCFNGVLSTKYVLEAPNYNNADTKFPWGKIYLKGTEMQEFLDLNLPYNKGIFIDVFVIENVANNKLIRYFDACITTIMKYVATSMLFYRYPNYEMQLFFSTTIKTLLYYRVRQVLGFFFSFVTHKTWLKWYDLFASRHKGETQKVTIPTGTKLYFGEMQNRNVWQPYSKAEFNGLKVNIPHDSHKYLSTLYGKDYMQEPPVEKRISHFVISLSFPSETKI